MYLKNDTRMGIIECFESLREKGYKVSEPKIEIYTDNVYEVGTLLPKTINTQVTATIVIALTEADLELGE